MLLFGLVCALGFGVASAQQVRIGMAFDAGGKYDKSFNQGAWEGAQRAAKEFKLMLSDFEPSDPAQVGQGIRSFAQTGFDLIMGVGYANEPAITATAKENPDLSFAVVDSGDSDAKNVAGLVFRENEGSYLVGYLAASNSSTGIIGFIGGMNIPLIKKFEVGYRAGAKAANKNIKIITQYLGSTPSAWNDPAKAKEVAGSMKAKGVDIIYAAAGGSGNGLIDYVKATQCIKASDLPAGVTFKTDMFKNVPKAASYLNKCKGNTRPMFFIGVDKNQNYLGDTDKNPKTLNHGLTSMLKRVDNAVYEVIKNVVQNNFQGGVRDFGLRENGVDYAYDEYNSALINSAQRKILSDLRKNIVLGKIKVPVM